MRARAWLAAGLLSAAWAGVGTARGEGASERAPNIVILFADDLGWADLGCQGNRFNETPRLDRLASEGLRFTNAYAAAPVCSPTRAALLSGQYQARFGLTAHIPGHWRPFERLAEPPTALNMPGSIETLAERLKTVGYATAHLGKWHLGNAPGCSPREQGFDVAVDLNGHDVPPRLLPEGSGSKRSAAHLADLAIGFMEANRDRPFLLQVSYFAVHIPLNTTPELEAKYRAKAPAEGYSNHPLYAGLLEEMDASAGRIADAVDALGLGRETLILLLSDNGGLEREAGGWPGTLNRPLRNEKGSLYEGGVRVPAIARWTGRIAPGGVSDVPTITTDIYPTALELAGAPAPDAESQPLDGRSLVPLFADPTADPGRDALYWHYPHYHHSRPSGAIRRGDWKLIEFFDTGEAELYHLGADVSESEDRSGDRPELAKELLSALRRWRQEVNAQMPQANPAHDPARAGEWWSRAKVEPTEAPGFYAGPR